MVRFGLLLAALLVCTSPATAQSRSDGTGSVIVDIDADTGAVIASSVASAEPKSVEACSNCPRKHIVFWLEARRLDGGPVEVFIMGQRVSYVLPDEANQGEFGPWNAVERAFIGSPWTQVTLHHPGASVECVSSQHWCSVVVAMEIKVPPDMVRAIIADGGPKDIRISTTKRKRVEWRIRRDEVVRTLAALDAATDHQHAR